MVIEVFIKRFCLKNCVWKFVSVKEVNKRKEGVSFVGSLWVLCLDALGRKKVHGSQLAVFGL